MATIVIVEDDMDDVILLNEIFSSTEYAGAIQFFSNAEAVIPFFDAVPVQELPSLVISDINMPKLNGFELLKALKGNERYHNIPVVICSTSNSEKEKQKSFSLGAHDFITKPVERKGYSEIIERVSKILNNHDGKQQ